MFEEFNNVEKNRSIVAMLVEMMKADQFSSPIEDAYVKYVAMHLGISEDEVDLIKNKPEQFPFVAPESEQDRMTILYYLLFTMRVDGEIKEKEEAICHKVGLKLGFNPALTQDLIQVMKKYAKDEVPPEAMLEQIRKYLN